MNLIQNNPEKNSFVRIYGYNSNDENKVMVRRPKFNPQTKVAYNLVLKQQ